MGARLYSDAFCFCLCFPLYFSWNASVQEFLVDDYQGYRGVYIEYFHRFLLLSHWWLHLLFAIGEQTKLSQSIKKGVMSVKRMKVARERRNKRSHFRICNVSGRRPRIHDIDYRSTSWRLGLPRIGPWTRFYLLLDYLLVETFNRNRQR